MDQIDEEILAALCLNGRASASEIGRSVSLSVPAVTERMRKMEESGVIDRYTVRLGRAPLGYGLLAMVLVTIDDTAHMGPFRQQVVTFSEVLECHRIAGEYDYLLKVLTRDTGELEHFLSHKLKRIRGLKRTSTQIVLSTLKEEFNR